MAEQLIDKFGRVHDYLRISLIERCNLRCSYCMPEEGIPLREKEEFMTHEEIAVLAKVFANLGVKKVRLTGGEPLIKKGFDQILKNFSKLNFDLNITTNGILLDKYWEELMEAQVSTLNISLDSLHKNRFHEITRRDYFDRVWKNTEEAVKRGFNVKLNAVLMKGFNDDEIIDFIRLSEKMEVDVRFIEFMPFDGNKWDWSKKVSYEEILAQVRMEFKDKLEILHMEKNGTARNFQINGFKGRFGIISSVTNPFCDGCNRIRLTADGKIKNCLFSNDEIDLLTPLREGREIQHLIVKSINEKHAERGGISSFSSEEFSVENREMIRIGG